MEYKPWSLSKDSHIISFLIVLFSILNEAASQTTLIQKGQAVYMKKKEDTEITKLNFDYRPLEDKIFTWLGDRNNIGILELTEEESKQFEACVHAAYYLKTEAEENRERINPKFLAVYDRFFKPPEIQ